MKISKIDLIMTLVRICCKEFLIIQVLDLHVMSLLITGRANKDMVF
jgi:hypothetical protein